MSSPYETPSADLQGGGNMNPCKGCAKELHVTAATCPHCGASQRSSGYKGKTTAAVLAFFLGGFGAHRFYLGQWWGLFYLLFFWTLIPGIVAFIEFIVFLASDLENWDRKYNDGKAAGPNEKSGGAAIVMLVVIGVFVIIAVIGILAAIAIPQYADYTKRAKVASTLIQMTPVKQSIEAFYQKHQTLPESNIMAGIAEPYIVEGNHEVIIFEEGFELRFSGSHEDFDAKTIVFIPYLNEGNIVWDCASGTLPLRYRPRDCRGQ